MQNTLITPSVIHSRSLHQELTLDAPDIEGAFHDDDNPGLLPIAILTDPIVVSLKSWPAALPGYTYQLFFNGELIGPAKPIIESDKPGDRLTLEIPLEMLSEGIYTIGYEAVNVFNQVKRLSELFTFTVDTTAPGAPELASIQFPPEVQGGLTSSELVQLGGQLNAHVAGYTGMAKHDRIQTYWGSEVGPEAVVNEDDMGLNKVELTFTREFLEAIGEDEQLVKYHISDRAGNLSEFSNTISITLKLKDAPSDFPAPIIDVNLGELIDYTEAQAGVKVDIPRYPGVMALDRIKLIWGEGNDMSSVEIPTDNGEDIILSLRVPFETINRHPQETISVFYQVERRAELFGSSLAAVKEVYLTLPVPSPLAALVIQGTSISNPNTEDNFIDEDDYELNSRALVSWSPSFAVNDDLNLYWGEQVILQWHQITSPEVTASRDLVIPVDSEIMKLQGTGAETPVYYSTTRLGNPNSVKSQVQSVTIRSKEELPGGSEGLEGPEFNLTSTGVLGPNENPNGADITIKPFKNMLRDQTIHLTFKGFDSLNNTIEEAAFSATRKISDDDIAHGYIFTVPHRNIRTICTGYAEANFRVEPVDGSNQSAANSKTTRVPVLMLDPAEITCSL